MTVFLLVLVAIALIMFAKPRAIPYDVRPINRDQQWASAMDELSIAAHVSAASLARFGKATNEIAAVFAEMARTLAKEYRDAPES